MHLMITKSRYKGRVLQHAKIVETYREKGKTPRKRTILNLGHVNSKKDLERYQEILQDMKGEKELVRVDNISVDNSKQFGITYTANKLMVKYGISNILKEELSGNDAKFDVYNTIKALIINRLERPSSELCAYDWIVNDYCEELNVQEHHLYRALDYLIPKKEKIEKGIFNVLKKKLRLDTKSTFYDLTSSYFEGQCCPIALYGHSRDHRRDRKQIVIALAMCDGIPIMHEVYKGNTADKKTLPSLKEELKNRFGIRKTIILADSGLMTDPNIAKLELENYDYILGCDRRKTKISEELLVKRIDSKENQHAKKIYEEDVKINESFLFSIDRKKHQEEIVSGMVSQKLRHLFKETGHLLSDTATLKLKQELKKAKQKNQWRVNDKQNNCTYALEKQKDRINIYKERTITKRYILCFDKDTRKLRLEELDRIRKHIENKLKELAERYKKSQTAKKGKKMTKESLIVKTYKILGKNKRLFNPEFKNSLTYHLNKERWKYERKIAGKFLLVTNTKIETNKAMRAYKELQVVENAFDEFKNFLKVRGIYHRKERRVRAHVFVCVLSFLIESIIEKFSEETARKIITKLKRVTVITLDLNGKKKKLVTKLSKEMKKIFTTLKISPPISLMQ